MHWEQEPTRKHVAVTECFNNLARKMGESQLSTTTGRSRQKFLMCWGGTGSLSFHRTSAHCPDPFSAPSRTSTGRKAGPWARMAARPSVLVGCDFAQWALNWGTCR